MQELYNIGISENTIKQMVEINSEIAKLTDNEIIEKEEILREIKCDKFQILNIISSNPNYLTRTNGEIIELLKYLTNLGFTCLNILFDSNPYILNLEPFEIKRYIEERIKNGEDIEQIIDDLDSNPYLFSEI